MRKFLKILILAFGVVQFSISGSTAADDKKALAKAIAELMVSEAQYLGIMEARKDLIGEQTKAALAPHFDMTRISDNDFNVFLDIFAEESAAGMVRGLRHAFAGKLGEELTVSDLNIMRTCLGGGACVRSKYSPSGLKTLLGLAKFGKEAGRRIGFSVGNAVSGQVIKRVQESDYKRFDDAQSVIDMILLRQKLKI